jgi:hypothetical protein
VNPCLVSVVSGYFCFVLLLVVSVGYNFLDLGVFLFSWFCLCLWLRLVVVVDVACVSSLICIAGGVASFRLAAGSGLIAKDFLWESLIQLVFCL